MPSSGIAWCRAGEHDGTPVNPGHAPRVSHWAMLQAGFRRYVLGGLRQIALLCTRACRDDAPMWPLMLGKSKRPVLQNQL